MRCKHEKKRPIGYEQYDGATAEWCPKCGASREYPWGRWTYPKYWKEYKQTKNEREQLYDMTRELDEHPDDYHGPCECKTCMSYAEML